MVEQAREIEQLQAELRRQQHHMALLRDVALANRAAADPQQIFREIYERLVEVLPIDAFFVALCEREGAPDYRVALMIDSGEYYELTDTRVGGLTSYLLQHKQPLLFRDLHNEIDPTVLPRPDKFGRHDKLAKSWMGVPLLIGREAVGVISAQSYSAGMYDKQDLQLLMTIGDLAAIAIENAMLYQAQDQLNQSLAERVTARSEELAVLTAIAITFSQGQPLAVMLDEVLERVLWLLGMDAGAIFLRERRTVMQRAAWRSDDSRRPPLEWLEVDGTSPEAEALRNGRLIEELQAMEVLLAMPLRAHGQSVGVMTLYGPPRALTEHERSLLEAASYQIAVGLENARLLNERERQIAWLEALTNIAAAGASTLDLRPMLEQVLAVLQSLLPGDGFIAATYDADQQVLTTGLRWRSGEAMEPINQLLLNDSTRLAYMLRQQHPILVRHIDPLHIELMPRQTWEHGALSWLGVPLISRDNVPIGLVAVQSQRPDAYDQRDQQFLSAVAHQLALNVENAQLYQAARSSAAVAEERANKLALVHNISRLVNSSLNPREVLGIAAEELAKLFGCDHCGIVLYATGGWRGEVVAEYPALGSLGSLVDFNNVEDFRDDVHRLGQPIYISDIMHDPRARPARELAQRLQMRSLLIVPLISRGHAVGAIGLLNRSTDRSFTPEEFDLCRTIAAQVAIALENARLFELSVTRIEQELDIARSIQANLFPRSLPAIPDANLAARCVPARETGGDFYDVLPLNEQRFGISVGDVSGKSLPAAMLMAVARSIVRSEALDHTPPDEVLAQTNELVAQDVPENTYVALCYAVYDASARRLELALGGQLTPLLRKRDGSTSFLEARGDLPLGIVPGVRYAVTHVQLAPGDTVLLYTDGLVEAFSTERELFGFERLRRTFAECGDFSPTEAIDHLFATVQEWQAGGNQHDDMTAVVLQLA